MEIYKTLEAIKNSNKKARQQNNYYQLLLNSQAMLDYLPDLIDYNVEQEHLYRRYEAEELTKENMTSAKAETNAKATEYYKEFTRSKLYREWIYEAINIAKKLAVDTNNNFKAS